MRPLGGGLLGLLIAMTGAGPAGAFDARVRWLPSGTAGVAGYHIYVRAAGRPYGAPIDAGLPAAMADGSLAFVVGGLESGITYHFGATAYGSGGAGRAESALSEEVRLGTAEPCRVDRCRSPAACDFGPAPDGTPCDDADGCTVGDTCRSGICSGVGVPPSAGGCCGGAVLLPPWGGTVTGSTSDGSAVLTAGCVPPSDRSPEAVFAWTPAVSGTATIATCGAATGYDTVLSLRRGSCAAAAEVACNDDACAVTGSATRGSRLAAAVTAGETYYIIVDGYAGRRGPFALTVAPPGDGAAPPLGDPACVPGGCNDGNPCTDDACAPAGGCVHTANTAACDDDSFCNGREQCGGGRCRRLAAPDCADGLACTVDSCDEGLGRCRHVPLTGCCAGDAACADSDVCTAGERCAGGTCTSLPVVCPEGPCNAAVCDPGRGCDTMPLADGAPCDDGDPCTADAICLEGACVGETAGVDLADLHVTLTPLDAGTRLSATGTFRARGAVDPTSTGATIDVTTVAGDVLYHAVASPRTFTANRYLRSFWFTPPADPEAASGSLRRLDLVVDQSGSVAVTARASGPELDGVRAEAVRAGQLVWVLRLGSECARGTALACEVAANGVVTCR